MTELSDDPDCGPDYPWRQSVRKAMLAEGMEPHILLTEERFRFMRKANRNNRLSVDALLGTGFQFADAGLAARYRRHGGVVPRQPLDHLSRPRRGGRRRLQARSFSLGSP